MANTYAIGDLVNMTSSFATVAGAAVDPTAVLVRVKDPSGAVTVLTYPSQVTKDSVGSYHANFATVLAGIHYYRWEGTGAAQAAAESFFYVAASQVLS
jgi:hypothetical protein